AGRTERMGLEAGGELNFTMGLTANVAVTISKNEYKEYSVDSVHYGNPGATADYSGNKVVGVPETFASFGLRYAPKPAKWVFITASVQTVGEYFADDANAISVPSYTILNAGIGLDRWAPGGGNVYFSAFAGVNNAADTKYIGSA